ncbi:hypothetical protein pipiens_014262 [Culex pipiens pipiens]|uniref:Secreted protein n=1 Tax=Culex pipiens pipiens TaxID=38569 RepID=A0ABD1CVB8_CULPP
MNLNEVGRFLACCLQTTIGTAASQQHRPACRHRGHGPNQPNCCPLQPLEINRRTESKPTTLNPTPRLLNK